MLRNKQPCPLIWIIVRPLCVYMYLIFSILSFLYHHLQLLIVHERNPPLPPDWDHHRITLSKNLLMFIPIHTSSSFRASQLSGVTESVGLFYYCHYYKQRHNRYKTQSGGCSVTVTFTRTVLLAISSLHFSRFIAQQRSELLAIKGSVHFCDFLIIPTPLASRAY